MAVRIGSRIDVRLGEEHRAKLEKIVKDRGGTVSEAVRDLIDNEVSRIDDREFASLLQFFRENPGDLPDWDDLKKEIGHGHCPGDGPWCDDPEYHAALVH